MSCSLSFEKGSDLISGSGVSYQVLACSHSPCSREKFKEEIRLGWQRLSPRSRWNRFGMAMNRLPNSHLDYLSDLDGVNRVALCAVTQEGAETRGIGLARYVRVDPRAPDAEFALTVIDEYQGQGIGRILLEKLIDAAGANGIDFLTGDVSADNHAMLKICTHLGAAFTGYGSTVQISISTRAA